MGEMYLKKISQSKPKVVLVNKGKKCGLLGNEKTYYAKKSGKSNLSDIINR